MSPTYFTVQMHAAEQRLERARVAGDIAAMQVELATMTRLTRAYFGQGLKAQHPG